MMETCKKKNIDFLFVDLEILFELGNADVVKKSFRLIKNHSPLCHIVVMGETATLRPLIKILKLGADDYLTIPIVKEEFIEVLESASEHIIQQTELDYLRGKIKFGEDLNSHLSAF